MLVLNWLLTVYSLCYLRGAGDGQGVRVLNEVMQSVVTKVMAALYELGLMWP